MARTQTARPQRARSRPASSAGSGLFTWRRLVVAISAVVILLSAGIAAWHPPVLARLLDPAWRFGGVGLFLLFPTWLAALYLAARAAPQRTLRLWQWWVSSLLVVTALAAVPSAAGGMSVGYAPLDSEIGAIVSGGTGFTAWLRLAGVFTVAFVIVFPRLAALALSAAAAGAAKLFGTVAKRTREAAERRAAERAWRRAEVAGMDDRGREDKWGAGDADDSEWSDAEEEDDESTGPRIVLAGRFDDEEDETEPEFDDDAGDDSPSFEEGAPEEPAPVSVSGAPAAARAIPTSEPPSDEDPFISLPDVKWAQPPIEMFTPEPEQQIDHEAQLETASSIESTLGEYNIEATVTEVRPGPTVTLFGVRPGWIRRFRETKERDAEGNQTTRRDEVSKTRVKVDRIAAMDRDLALHLKAPSIRVEAPIPGTNLVGIEVPNADPQSVHIRTLLQSEAYRRLGARTKLAIPLGKGSGGEPVVADLARAPHLLIAGSTGSGKSVFVNNIIVSLLWNATPNDVRMILIDPKRVELTVYNGIPHLITPVIVETNKSINALRWMTMQMEDRLRVLSEEGVRDIASYNKKANGRDRLPYLVLVVDELADLMMTAGKSFEQALVRLAQMGRATGIHLVVATQRPSVDVITGLIKANFPTRASFMVTALVDSRTILDGSGAEKLLGRGDMLYLPQDAARPSRIQSAFISDEEATKVSDFWRQQAHGYEPPELPDLLVPDELLPKGKNGTSAGSYATGDQAPTRGLNGSGDVEEAARELAETYNGRVSTSLLQRRLGIGYPRAARLRDQLVEEGLATAEIPNAPAETAGRGRRAARKAAGDGELDD